MTRWNLVFYYVIRITLRSYIYVFAHISSLKYLFFLFNIFISLFLKSDKLPLSFQFSRVLSHNILFVHWYLSHCLIFGGVRISFSCQSFLRTVFLHLSSSVFSKELLLSSCLFNACWMIERPIGEVRKNL